MSSRPAGSVVDVWSGYFDREGRPLYESDIVSLHYSFEVGWVHGRVSRQAADVGFFLRVHHPQCRRPLGVYWFSETFWEGTYHENPGLLALPVDTELQRPMVRLVVASEGSDVVSSAPSDSVSGVTWRGRSKGLRGFFRS